ncbi:MAG: HAMP domain-containing sensor histidine kinase [Alphaproteobacteria bacterium]
MTSAMRQMMAPVAGLLGASAFASAGAALATTHALGAQSIFYVIPAFALLFAASIGLFLRVRGHLLLVDRRIDAAEGRIAEQSAALAEGEERARLNAEFLAELSHELRTPLSAVLGFSETMRSQMFGPIGGKRYRDYAGHINATARHMFDLLSDVLDLSQAEAGRLPLTESRIDVNAMIREALAMVSREAEIVQVRLSSAASRRVGLLADERRVRQMLLNLLTNAIKFTPAGGRVEIRIRTTRSGRLTIAVRDTGIGIKKDEIERILSPRGRIRERDPSTCPAGTGIGLALTRRLIERHGGGLEIESAPGQGTTAILSFPANRVFASEAPAGADLPRLRLVGAG